MSDSPVVPEPFSARLGMPDDLEEVLEVITADDEETVGTSSMSLEQLETFLNSPEVDADEGIVTVWDEGGRIVGGAAFALRSPFVQSMMVGWVHPDVYGRGVGQAIVTWGIGRAHASVELAPDGALVETILPINVKKERATRLAERNGFAPVRYFLEMATALDRDVDVPPVPDDLALRTMRSDEGIESLAMAIDDAFRDHYGHVDAPIETVIARMENFRSSPMWDDSLVWLAEDGGEIAGFCVCITSRGADPKEGYVGSLGVRRPWRKRGLARFLLTNAFAEYQRRGYETVALDVDADSPTGAIRLYESVGMSEVSRTLDYALTIRDGEDLATR